jgi:hypothetical protein
MSIAPRIARRGLIHREVYTKYTDGIGRANNLISVDLHAMQRGRDCQDAHNRV